MKPIIFGIPVIGFMGYVVAFALGVWIVIDIYLKGQQNQEAVGHRLISVQREGGFALDKVAGYVVDTVMRVAVDGIDQVSCRTPSDGFGFVVDRRQCGPRAGGQYRPVIVADDGDVIPGCAVPAA